MVTAPARREVVREMVAHGLSERRALTVVRMSAAARRYVPDFVCDPRRPSLRRHRRLSAYWTSLTLPSTKMTLMFL